MKYLLVLALSLLSLPAISQTTSENEVKATFSNYKSAILNQKGEEAVNWVDSRTLKYYGDMLEVSKKADSLELDKLSILDKMMVLAIKHRTPTTDILSFDGKQMLAYAVKNGMVGKNSVANTEIGEIKIEGDFAQGQMINNGNEAPFYFHFYKENDSWKLDLTSLFSISAVTLNKVVADSGQPENEFIMYILEMVSGKKVSNAVWHPLQ